LGHQPLDFDELVQPLDAIQDGQSLLLGYIAQRLQLVAEPAGLRDVFTQIELAELVPKFLGPVVETPDNSCEVPKQLPEPAGRLRVDDAPRLQAADDGLDEPGDEPRVRFGKHSPAEAAERRRDVTALEPWHAQELKNRR